MTASADPNPPRRAVFLDRDGVLNRRPLPADYVKSAAEFVWLEGAREGVLRLNEAGWLVLVVTNQRGVARGLMTEQDVEAIHAKAQRELQLIGAHVDAFYYCPHCDEDDCACRKPRPGLILQAAQDWNVSLDASILIGDDDRDIEAARRAGLRARRMPTDGNLAHTLAEIFGSRAEMPDMDAPQ